MTDHFDIEAVWNSQTTGLADTNPEQLIMTLAAAQQAEDRRLLHLNIQEVTPAVGVAAFFLWQSTRAATAGWTLVLAAVLGLAVGGFLLMTSLQQAAAGRVFGTSLRDELERSRAQLSHRAWLYRNVAWWYVLPLMAAIALAWFGPRIDRSFTVVDGIYSLVVVGVGIGLYVWNRRIGRTHYETKVASLNELIDDLDTP